MKEKRTERLKKWFSNKWHRRLFILGVVLCAFSLWFFPTWSKEQKLADKLMEELIATIEYTEMEKMSDEEIQWLFQNYTIRENMNRFKEERKEVFIERMNGVSDLKVTDIRLTRHATGEAKETPYLQLGFVCELDDSVSESLEYVYRYYKDGTVEKMLVYHYQTIKNKLFFEKSKGITAAYSAPSGEMWVMDFPGYDEAMRVLWERSKSEY